MDIEAAAGPNPSEHAETHIQQYLASDGRDVDHPAGDRLILLYTTGRSSGEIRRVPLGSFPDGDALVVIGSNAGRPTDPQWYRNLQADSKVWVRHMSDFYEATATTMEPEARRAYWEELTTRMPVFAEFQEKAGRDLPLVRITRVSG